MKDSNQLSLFPDEPNKMDEGSIWTLYLDGASRNNPGPSGAGFHLLKDGQTVSKEGFYLGVRTNNQAEYLALLLGLFFLHEYMGKQDKVRIISDSELLVKQVRGEYRVKNEKLRPLFTLAQKLLRSWTVTIFHVLRKDNVVADAMANTGIDKKKSVPSSFLVMLKNNEIQW